MSFSKTVSVFAALASIFAAGAAGWKLSQDQSQTVEKKEDVSVFEEKINDLEKQLKEVKERPKPAPVVVQQPTVLPPLPPVPEPKPGEFE
jgi:hypothetical protein